MSKGEKKLRPALSFLARLYGNTEELEGEDLDSLFEAIAPGEDAAAKVHELAHEAATKYWAQGQSLPDHVRSAFHTTKRFEPTSSRAKRPSTEGYSVSATRIRWRR